VKEELYNIKNDPAELKDLASEDGANLEEMRKVYDKHLAHWKEEAVSYNNYKQYGIVFDRTAPWEEKKPLYIKSKWK